MIGIIRNILVVIGAIASIICVYFVSISFSSQFIAESPIDGQNQHANSNSKLSKPDSYSWILKPDSSFNDFNLLPKWGSFRPGHYFGMKSIESSLSTGIMWLDSSRQNLRHKTQQGEIQKLDWIEHDGMNYGNQILVDSNADVSLDTTFIVPTTSQYSWLQKIVTKANADRSDADFPFFYYFGSDCFDDNTATCETFSNVRVITSKATADRNLLFHLIAKTNKNKWVSFQLFVNDFTKFESISYFVTSKVVFSATNYFKSELLRENNNRGRSKDSTWLDEFGDLKNAIEASNILRTAQLQVKGKKNVEFYVSLRENLSEKDASTLFEKSRKEGGLFLELTKEFDELRNHYSQEFQNKFQRFVASPVASTYERDTPSESELSQIQIALSSLLGGIGYFEGNSRIEWNVDAEFDTVYPSEAQANNNTKALHLAAKANDAVITKLLTATPSRTVFPRGFLWDEGFHQFIISHWNPLITIKVISDWMNAMYLTDYYYQPTESSTPQKITIGWIPREMILGEDARQRVPDEFITQRLNIANPPTFLLVIEKLLDSLSLCATSSDKKSPQVCENNPHHELLQTHRAKILQFVKSIYPRLHAWIQWFRITQESINSSKDSKSPVFRWRGRSAQDTKVVPNTLSSGLDDYPRSIYPTGDERHIDLLCWITKAYQIMDKIEILLSSHDHNHHHHHQKGSFQDLQKSLNIPKSFYGKEYTNLLQSMHENHYSPELHGYFDYGVNNESAVFLQEILFRCYNPENKQAIDGYIPIYYLQNKVSNFCPPNYPQPAYPLNDGNGNYMTRERLVAENFTMELIPRIGYVNLFPFLLKLLAKDQVRQIQEILVMMEDPKLLFTEYGLRSMATTDKFYMKRNAPGDAPYWRGPIWININYLALSALHYYAQDPSPYQVRAQICYEKLRNGILKNVLKEQRETGFFWEQYDDQTGKGIRGHPFTGWTATIVNIFFEWY